MTLGPSILLDYPPLLGIGLILAGAFIAWLSLFVSEETELSGSRAAVIGLLTAMGIAAGVYQVHLSEPLLLAAVFGAMGNYIEGLAAFRLYQKLSYGLRNRTTDLPGVGIKPKVLSSLVIVFFVFLAGSIASILVLSEAVALPLPRAFAAIWAVFTVLYTAFSLGIKLSGFDSEFPRAFVAGLILLVAGANVYEFGGLSVEIVSALVGSAAYTAGFWLAAYELLTEDLLGRSTPTSAFGDP
jgi:hypothetical protein